MDFYAAYDDPYNGSMEPQPFMMGGGGHASVYPPQYQQQQPPAQQQHQQPAQQQQMQYKQPPPVMYRQKAEQQPQYAMHPDSKPGFIDRMFSKRKDFFKLLILALIVVLALSLHGIVKYLMKMNDDAFSTNQVLSLKIVYCLSVGLLLWILKTLNSDDK